jgi:very-short-patch-repair endonuclease
MTYAEQRAWETLRTLEGLPGRFRRQCPIGPYTVDFVCHAMKLIVELEGGIHKLAEVAARDDARAAWLTSQGFTVIRIPNDEAIDPDALAARIFG